MLTEDDWMIDSIQDEQPDGADGNNRTAQREAMHMETEGGEHGSKFVVTDFELEEGNCMSGTTWISFTYNGERFEEPVFISFKDILTLFRNEGTEPDDEHDGRYRFTRTPVALGASFWIEIDEACFGIRHCEVVDGVSDSHRQDAEGLLERSTC